MLGRTYKDFLVYVEENKNKLVWQYDSVKGKIDDKKAILTLIFLKYRFQFGLLIQKQKSSSVLSKIRKLQKILGDDYMKIFQR